MADTDFVYDPSIAPFPVASLGNQRYRAKFEDINLYVKQWSGGRHRSIGTSNLDYWFIRIGIPWLSGSLQFCPDLSDWWSHPLVEWEKSKRDFREVPYQEDYTANKDQHALEDLDRAIELDPSDASAYRSRGDIYGYTFKDYQHALADLDRAIELDPADASAYKSRGDVYYELKDYQHALADLDRAIELAPADNN